MDTLLDDNSLPESLREFYKSELYKPVKITRVGIVLTFLVGGGISLAYFLGMVNAKVLAGENGGIIKVFWYGSLPVIIWQWIYYQRAMKDYTNLLLKVYFRTVVGKEEGGNAYGGTLFFDKKDPKPNRADLFSFQMEKVVVGDLVAVIQGQHTKRIFDAIPERLFDQFAFIDQHKKRE